MVYSGGRYVNYRYNAEGSLAELDYGEGDAAPTATYRFEYDSLGRLIRSQQRDGNTVTQRTEQLYDTANRLSAQGWTIGGTSYRESDAYDAADGSLKKNWGTSNIFNIVSSGDVIPRILPAEWGFYRNGNDRFLPSTVIPEELQALNDRSAGREGTPMDFGRLAVSEETDAVLRSMLDLF